MAFEPSFGEAKNRLRYEASSLHAAAEALCGTLQRHRTDFIASLETRIKKLEAECDALRAKLNQQEHDDAIRFEQAKVESVELARMWEAEKKRLLDEIRELNEDLVKARRAADDGAAGNRKLRIELNTYAEELRMADARESALAATQAERDSAIAETAGLRRELAILRSRLGRAEPAGYAVHETVQIGGY